MTTQTRIDYLNIGLLVLSFIAAVLLPFELFLFSYAVLGPLHYITEIAWLDQRNFFLKRRKDVFFLVGICFLIFVQTLVPTQIEDLFIQLNEYLFAGQSQDLLIWVSLLTGALTVLLFFASYFFNKTENYWATYLWLGVSLYLIIVCQVFLPAPYKFLAMMLPTIIHVCVFTGMFILSGALKQNTASSYGLFAAYVGFVIAFFVCDLSVSSHASAYAIAHYTESNFLNINKALLGMLGRDGEHGLFEAGIGRNIQAFIAFVYTYHYLNWFSKTGLTGWHQVARVKLIAFALVWFACLALYAYNYRLGLQVLACGSGIPSQSQGRRSDHFRYGCARTENAANSRVKYIFLGPKCGFFLL
jgi:hypothetical protein